MLNCHDFYMLVDDDNCAKKSKVIWFTFKKYQDQIQQVTLFTFGRNLNNKNKKSKLLNSNVLIKKLRMGKGLNNEDGN